MYKVYLLTFCLPELKFMVTAVCSAVRSRSVVSDSCDPVDCSLPASYVLGTLQARILERVATPCSRESFRPRDQTHISYVSCIAVGSLPPAPLGKPLIVLSLTVHLTLRLRADIADTQMHFSISLQNANRTMETAWKFIFIT